MDERSPTDTIPLIEEALRVTTRQVETGHVRVRTVVGERAELAEADLFQETVDVRRVPIDREVDAVPPIREEGDTMIVSVVEEVMVVQKRLILREEVHLKRTRSVERFAEPVTLRTMQAVVERAPTDPQQEFNR